MDPPSPVSDSQGLFLIQRSKFIHSQPSLKTFSSYLDSDAARSYPARGKLRYTMPSFEELLGIPVDQAYQLADFDFLFDASYTLETEVSVLNNAD